MEVAKDILEFLDLKLKFDKEHKRISVDIFVKVINSFIYILPSTCFPKNSFENVPAEHKPISVDIFGKSTNSFTCGLPSTCFPKNSMENVFKGVA